LPKRTIGRVAAVGTGPGRHTILTEFLRTGLSSRGHFTFGKAW
jgi:hypothetical protein